MSKQHESGIDGCILIVEDDIAWADILVGIVVSNFDGQVLAARNRDQAVSILSSRNDISLVILDTCLSEGGRDWEGMLILSRISKEIPCIVVSETCSPQRVSDLYGRYGIKGYYSKMEFCDRLEEFNTKITALWAVECDSASPRPMCQPAPSHTQAPQPAFSRLVDILLLLALLAGIAVIFAVLYLVIGSVVAYLSIPLVLVFYLAGLFILRVWDRLPQSEFAQLMERFLFYFVGLYKKTQGPK